jgi:hypothetical protein
MKGKRRINPARNEEGNNDTQLFEISCPVMKQSLVIAS